MKIGLVLGGGGFVGGAWLTGALEALEDRTGVLPPRFDRVVGTSAGAMIAALTASGVHPADVAGLFAGEGPGASVEKPTGATLKLENRVPRLVPGSVRLAFNAVRHPRQHRIGVAMAAIMPRGFLSTQPLRDMVSAVIPSGWSPHQSLWVMACHLGTGGRVSFGRDDAPRVDLADAVAASCAIPGFYCPVSIDGADYVDGGCYSPSNLDVLRHGDLDLVICFNPTSSMERTGQNRITERIGDAYRGVARALLEREAQRLRDAGTRVLLVQPTADDLAVMGTNMMASGNLSSVSEVARKTVARQLDRAAATNFLDTLARAQPTRRRPARSAAAA